MFNVPQLVGVGATALDSGFGGADGIQKMEKEV